jgi:hypothetical protein
VDADEIAVTGDAALRRTMTKWLQLSVIVEAARHAA